MQTIFCWLENKGLTQSIAHKLKKIINDLAGILPISLLKGRNCSQGKSAGRYTEGYGTEGRTKEHQRQAIRSDYRHQPAAQEVGGRANAGASDLHMRSHQGSADRQSWADEVLRLSGVGAEVEAM